MINDFDLKSNQTISIFPIGDVHVGTPFFNKEYFEYMLHKFDTAQGIKIIYLLGDLLDCATKRLGQSAYQQVLSPEEQLDYMVKSLKPFKEHIRGCVIGNHEARFRKEFDLDIMKILADNLWANHGTKTSQQQHLMQGAVMRQTQHIDANLYLYGHAHYLSNWSQVVKSGSDYKRRHYVLIGHYLKYDGSYAQEKLLKPSLEGFSKVTIDKNLRTDVTLYNIDEQPL